MDCSQRTCLPKRWNTEFLTYRNFKEETPYVRLKSAGDIESAFDGIENFMRDSEESMPSDQVDEVVEFCEGASSDNLRQGVGASGTYRRAWLDDREYSPIRDRGTPRRYTENPLTPSQLYQILQARRYNNSAMPDADRRLIYITNISPQYILAITETAPWHQVESLRDALWKHLASQTSIKVIFSQSFPIFHLEFHLPYLSLRKAPPKHHCQKPDNGRTWTDLSFLKLQKEKLQHFGLFEAQISFVIVGSDNYRWDGYCFAFDDEEDLLEDNDAIRMDPIFGNGNSSIHDANCPIWDPRKYFLAVFASRMTQILAQLEYVIRMLSKNIEQYENSHLPTLSPQPRNHTQDVKADFERVVLTMRLLSRIIYRMSEYTEVWENFSGYEGDLGYFSDIIAANDYSSQKARLSMEVIKQAFVKIQQQERELSRLEKLCEKSEVILQLQLTLAGSNSARNNEIVTGLTASVVNPIVVSAALFSMPEAVKLNPKPFVVASVIIVALMRLLMFIPGLFGSWPVISARIKAVQWDPRASMKIATTQTRHGAGEATYDVEMHPLDNR
ncbi:hypothetical protein DPV78_008323 [Talaromyces pinophilus]|nr:hypothetical protein DPV78_008323 [Talaromyces pinophilus]